MKRLNTSRYILLIITIITVVSCSKKLDYSKQKQKLVLDAFYVPKTCIVQPSEGIDSKTGLLICASDTFNYDLGRMASPGPMSLYDEFNNTFKSFHHRRFFKKVDLDPKLYTAFLDSVKVVEINHISSPKGPLMFTCDGCNAVATLQFKGTNFQFPYQVDQALLGTRRTMTFLYSQEGGYYRKIYTSKSSLKGNGLYTKPLDFDVNDLESKALSVTSTKLGPPSDYTLSILKNIKLK